MSWDAFQLRGDEFPEFVWPGGYPITYHTPDGATLCPECAKEEEGASGRKPFGGIYYEGPDLICDGCQKPIPSAYGDPLAEVVG